MALANSQSLRMALACVTISMAFVEIAQAAPIPKWNKKVRVVSMQEKTNEQVVSMLQSRDRELATQAVYEIMRRGEPMIPFLMHLKGDARMFQGRELGDPRSSIAVPLEVDKGRVSRESIVTNEVAALYLISAIYYGNRVFASPWLADASLPPEERRAQNSSYLISKAWEAVENWVNELKKESLDSLKSKKFNPLKNSGVTFFK
jgi:hypothetical protein